MTACPSSALRQAAGAWRAAPPTVRGAALVLFILSLLARVVLVTAVQPVLVSDARDYHQLAQNVAAGQGYVQVYAGETDVLFARGGRPLIGRRNVRAEAPDAVLLFSLSGSWEKLYWPVQGRGHAWHLIRRRSPS